MKSMCGIALALGFASLTSSLPGVQSKSAKPSGSQQQSAPAGQSRVPVEQLQIYMDGFHNYKNQASLPPEKQHQMRVTHYCQPLSDDFIQCVVYDGNTSSAHLIGIEHIISDKVFQSLPDGEKQYWHPHDGEVDSGMLDLPGVPAEQKTSMLQMIRSTHGKTWHVWDTSKDKVPLGMPSLMWAIDADKINSMTKHQMEERKRNPIF